MFIVVLGKNNSPLKSRLISQYITENATIYCNHTRAASYNNPRQLDVGLEDYYKLNSELRQIATAPQIVFDDVFYDGDFLKNSLNLLPPNIHIVLGISYPFEEIAAQVGVFVITNESDAIKKSAWEKWFHKIITFDNYMKLFEGVAAVRYDARQNSWV